VKSDEFDRNRLDLANCKIRISTNFVEFVNLAKSLPFHFILVLSFEKEILFISLESHFQP
jgi:hypothetical protein